MWISFLVPMDATKEWDCFIRRSRDIEDNLTVREKDFKHGRIPLSWDMSFSKHWIVVKDVLTGGNLKQLCFNTFFTSLDRKGTCAPMHCWIELKYSLKSVHLKHWVWHWHWVWVTEKLSAFMCSMWNCGSAQMQWLRPQPGSSYVGCSDTNTKLPDPFTFWDKH